MPHQPASCLRVLTSAFCPLPSAFRLSRISSPGMNIETRQKGDVTIVDFKGRLAVGVGDELLPRLVEQILGEGHRKILLNLPHLNYITTNAPRHLAQPLTPSTPHRTPPL